MEALYPAIATLVAYLIGSLSFAVVVSRAMGLSDPRTYGSKNPGATNVLRSGSKKAAILTLLLDALKGWLPVVAVKWWGEAWGLGDGTVALVGLAAFLGHLWPVFFRFVGGKGVATAAGVIIGFQPLAGPGLAADLGHRRLRVPLLVAGLHRHGHFCPGLFPLGSRCGVERAERVGPEPDGDGSAAGLAPRREHQPPAGGQGKQAGSEEIMSSDITRIGVAARYSEAAVFNGVVYLAGMVPECEATDIRSQTADVLAQIEQRLKEAGSDKSRILRTQIYLTDIREIGAMNEVWDAWVVPGTAPPRATVQAALADPAWKIEIVVTAAQL